MSSIARSPALAAARCSVYSAIGSPSGPSAARYRATSECTRAAQLRCTHTHTNPRASINALHHTIANTMRQSPSPYFPPRLLSLIDEAAKMERRSELTDEMYEQVVGQMSDFMLDATKSSSGGEEGRMTSEGVYNPSLLLAYDALVWGFNCPFLWRIAKEDVAPLYASNASKNHCEIGVGTGLLLSKEVTDACDAITLVDLNVNSLQSCAERVRRSYQNKGEATDIESMPKISTLVADITADDSQLSSLEGTCQSVAANFLFHCIHGSNLQEKASAFRNCASLLDPNGGVFFGSTILGKEMLDDEKNAGAAAVNVLRLFNESGVFGNLGDSMSDLESVLKANFRDVELKRVGYCGVWTAKDPRGIRG